MVFKRKSHNYSAAVWRLLGRYVRDRRGNVSVIVALMVVPLVGVLGLAGEVSTWYTVNRSLQNATDAAAVAAAKNADTTNDGGGLPRYKREAIAMASQYGWTTGGVNQVLVTPITVVCPSGTGTCYQVTIRESVPVLLTGVLGFTGNTTMGGGNAQFISATSIATAAGTTAPFCIVTLGGAGITQPLLIHGGPKTDLNGCSTVSNGSATCNGQPIGNIGDSYAIGTPNDCAPTGQNKTISIPVSDPYAGLSAQIPPNTCPSPKSAASYHQEPNKGFANGSANLINGTLSGTVYVCGDAQLSGDLTLNAGTLLVIENGVLDASGFTVTANQATIIFSGPTIAGFSPGHYPTDLSHPGAGIFNLTAPTSGTWKDVALLQDSALPAGPGVDIASAGNKPTWNINGVIDVPNASVTISGAINKGVADCFGIVAASLTINGTGSIANDAGCGPISVPGVGTGTTVALVQ